MKLYAYNKPIGEETAEKELEGVKLYPVSALAAEDKGLVVYTDDASQVAALNAKAAAAEQEVHVDTDKHLNTPIIQKIRADYPCRISWTEANAFIINIASCTRDLMKKICSEHDCSVVCVKRFRIANLKIKKVALGAFEEYSEDEVNAFLA